MSAMWDSMMSIWGTSNASQCEEPRLEVRLRPTGVTAKTPRDEGLQDTVSLTSDYASQGVSGDYYDHSYDDSIVQVAWDPNHDLSTPVISPPRRTDAPTVEDLRQEDEEEWHDSQYMLSPPIQQPATTRAALNEVSEKRHLTPSTVSTRARDETTS